MKSKILQCVLLLALGILLSVSVKAQNMSRYITLTVSEGQNIGFRLRADADNTPVSIVSGDLEYNIIVGTDWTSFDYYTSGATTMTIYGDVLKFNCSQNYSKITGIDASNNTALASLKCYNNQLTTAINLSQNAALEELSCSDNQLTSLDVSGCTALKYLSCSNNQLTSLDVSQNTALKVLGCYFNQLTSLDVSGCTALEELYCSDNQLTSLDASGCTALEHLKCFYNQLTSLDVSGCTALKNLSCYNNQLTSLDASGCTALEHLSCFNNQLTSLDASGCTALENLSCFNNQLISLDVSQNMALEHLECYFNQLTSLDVSGCTALKHLYCISNQLISLDISQNTALKYLNCHSNQLISLDVSQNTALKMLGCSYNQLTSLDISQNTALKELYCYGNLFNTNVVDKLFCKLPERYVNSNARIYILNNTSDANYADVIASNKQNAIDKNWNVWYYDNGWNGALHDTNIPETTGDYDCTTDIADIEHSNIEVYPNPVKAQLHIQSDTELIKVELYNVQGSLVQHHTHTTSIDVSSLSNGIYMLKLFTETGVYRTKIVKN